MTYGFGPRRRRRGDTAPEPEMEAEDWLAGYRPSSDDSDDDLFSPRSRRSAPVSPAPPEDYSETTGSFGPNGSFRPGGFGAPVEPEQDFYNGAPPADPPPTSAFYNGTPAAGFRGGQQAAEPPQAGFYNDAPPADPPPTSAFYNGTRNAEPPSSSPFRGGPAAGEPPFRGSQAAEPPTPFRVGPPAGEPPFRGGSSSAEPPASGFYNGAEPPTSSFRARSPRGEPSTSSFYDGPPAGSDTSGSFRAVPPAGPDTSGSFRAVPPTGPDTSGSFRAIPPTGPDTSGSFRAVPPTGPDTSGSFRAVPPTGPDTSGSFRAIPPTGSDTSGSFRAVPPTGPDTSGSFRAVPPAPVESPGPSFTKPVTEPPAPSFPAGPPSARSESPAPVSPSSGGVTPRRPPPGPAPHPDEEPIFRRVDLSPPSVPATAPQEEPILKYIEPRERSGSRSTYGGRRRAAEPRSGASSPVSSAPVTPAPISSPPTTGGRRRRYRDDDEPTSTGALGTEPRHAHGQLGYDADQRDLPQTPGYSDPQGRSSRYPIAEPTYVPAPAYDTQSRHSSEPPAIEAAAYTDAAGYTDAPPYGDSPSFGWSTPPGDEPQAGGFPYNEAAFGAPPRPVEGPVRPRRPDVSEGQPSAPAPPSDGMRTVRPDQTGGLPRLTNTSSGSIPRITASTTSSGNLPRIGPTTTGGMRPVRIDPVRPTQRTTSKWMVALASVGVLVLLAVCSVSTWLVFQDELSGSKGGNSAAKQPTNAPPAPRDISSRQVDPDPLTDVEVFPADKINGANGASYQVLKKEAGADCTKAATDDLAKLLTTNGCSQVVRGTLKSADGTYLITAGVFNLNDEQSAVNAHENINAIVAAQKGRFLGLLAGAGTEVLVRAPMILGWHARGHYLAYCVIARADGQGFDQADKTYTQIQADILTAHLRDGVIGARTVPKPSAQASGAPSPSTS